MLEKSYCKLSSIGMVCQNYKCPHWQPLTLNCELGMAIIFCDNDTCQHSQKINPNIHQCQLSQVHFNLDGRCDSQKNKQFPSSCQNKNCRIQGDKVSLTCNKTNCNLRTLTGQCRSKGIVVENHQCILLELLSP